MTHSISGLTRRRAAPGQAAETARSSGQSHTQSHSLPSTGRAQRWPSHESARSNSLPDQRRTPLRRLGKRAGRAAFGAGQGACRSNTRKAGEPQVARPAVVVQQIVTILGVLAGAGASFAATSMIERSKWKRTQAVRWDERRLSAYVAYANAVKRMNHLSLRLAAMRGLHPGPAVIDIDDGLSQLAAAEAERGEMWEAVRLLGGSDVVAAGEQLNRAAWRLEPFAIGDTADSTEWKAAHKNQVDRREAFYRAARVDLGVDVPHEH